MIQIKNREYTKNEKYLIGLKILGNEPVCCDANQVTRMVGSLRMAEGIFARCQTCLKNMMKSICSMTCAKDHSRFLNTTTAQDWAGKDFSLV